MRHLVLFLTLFFKDVKNLSLMAKESRRAFVTTPGSMKPIGILGGGQLARMMALRAHDLGLSVAILSEKSDDPAAEVATWKKGRLNNRSDLRKFLRSCSVVTFESEFLDADLLTDLAVETGTKIYPRPEDMARIQDRLTQKEWIADLPTAKFFAVGSEDEALEAFTALGDRAVFKKRRFGYDGYGTFVVRSARELAAFLPELARNPHGFIAEEFIPFRRELAFMIVRTLAGQTMRLPLVETLQENSRCLWVRGPVRESPALRALGRRLEKLLEESRYVGIMGVELFETRDGRFLINELAPRVHNSGHYSSEALAEDQFTLHLKAITGAPIGAKPVARSAGFAMMNLLGSEAQPSWRLPPDVSLHWYGKSENRSGRKMGHITALASTPERALKLLMARRRDFNV